MTPADKGDREQVAALAYVDHGCTGPNAAEAAEQHGLRLEVVKHAMANQVSSFAAKTSGGEKLYLGRMLPPPRPTTKRLDTTPKRLYLLAFVTLMLRNLTKTLN